MLSRWPVAPLAACVVACGAGAEPARQEAACAVRLPTAAERSAGEKAARRYDDLVGRTRASVRRMVARDDGSRHVDAGKLLAGQRARRDEGFPATREITRAVMLGSPGLSYELGVPITLSEFRLLDFRGEIGDHAPLAKQYARECLRRDYGGVYFDGDRNGQFLALPLTTGSPSARAQLAKRSTMGARFLRTSHVEYTAAELTGAKERISAELRAASDFHSIAPSLSDNRVVIRIHPFSARRAAELRERFGAIVLVRR